MLCTTCQTEGRKFGKDRYGNQRFQCLMCKKTYSDRPARPLDEMRLPMEKAIQVLRLLTEGCSVRSTVRLSGVAKDTVLALLAVVGQKVANLMATTFVGLPVNDVQIDEIWGFVGMKERTRKVQRLPEEGVGDAYCFVGIERDTKLILAWHLGKRSAIDTIRFIEVLNGAVGGRFQLTSDGWPAYPQAIEAFIEHPVDYARLIKTYGKIEGEEGRYSPPQVTGTDKQCCSGDPDPDRICTSHVERANLTIRMSTRRMTRLTNAFSKKWANHWYALALHFAHYNFCRRHGTIKMTPAMASGLADHAWSIEELLEKSTHC